MLWEVLHHWNFNSLKQLQSLMVDYDLTDIWRARNPTFRQFTWRKTNPVKLRRLYFFLISNSLQFDVRLCKFLSPVQSDHSPIVLKISSCAKSDSKRYANEKAEERKRKRVFLENKVLDLEKQMVNSPSIPGTLVADYKGAKTDLENLYNYIADGAILRSKVRWY